MFVRIIRYSERESALRITEIARARRELTVLVFVAHLGQSTFGDDVSSVDESVQNLGLILHGLLLRLRVKLDLLVQDQVQRVVEVRESGVESREIEGVADKVDIHLEEEVVALSLHETRDPATEFIRTGRGIQIGV